MKWQDSAGARSDSRPPPYARKAWRDAAGVWRDGEFWYDAAAGERSVRFIERCLTHVKGEWAGQPFLLEDWQKDVTLAIFGWKRPDGTRRFRTVFLYIPRKNGKTAFQAVLLLCLFFIDGEPGAEIYNVAGDRDQAKVCFNVSRSMVQASDVLLWRTQVFRGAMEIPATQSTYQALSSDAPGKHGKNPHGVGFDELHTQKDDALYQAMTTGGVSRRQPLIIFATTADIKRKSVCNREYEYARAVLEGTNADQHYLAVIFEAGEDDDWKLESTWRKANPNYGVSVKPEQIREAAERAAADASRENMFKRLHLNLRTEQVTRWIPVAQWDACAGPRTAAELAAALRGQACTAGLDVSTTQDLTALALVFPPAEGSTLPPFPPIPQEPGPEPDAAGQPAAAIPPAAAAPLFRALFRFWMPADNVAERVKRDRVWYDQWSRACHCPAGGDPLGCPAWLHLTPGNVVNQEWVYRDILALHQAYPMREIAVDRWETSWLMTALGGEGLEVLKHGQGYLGMNPAVKEVEKAVLGRRVEHGGHPVARWNFRNIAISRDPAGNMKFDKAKSTERIDGMVALAMALGRAALLADAGNAVRGGMLL